MSDLQSQEVGEDLPVVQWGPDLERVVNECEPYLAAHPRVYQRGGRLADVAINRIDGQVIYSIRDMPVAMVRSRLSASVDLQQWSKTEKTWLRVVPPDSLTHALFALGRWPHVRSIAGIRSSPFLRTDGTVCSAHGWDRVSNYALTSAIDLQIPEEPTWDDARESAELLLSLVTTNEQGLGFPFVNECHRIAWLAMILTMVGRPAIAGPSPAFGVSSTVKGTGKGKLVDAGSNIVMGFDAGKHPFPEKEEELRKTITSLFAAGKQLICFDNVDRQIQGASIDNAITATIWEDRELSRSKTLVLANNAVITFTGNNLLYRGDTSRRVIPIDLDPGVERPELRGGFRHPDLMRYIRKHRGKFLGAALTILRAYFVAGKPSQNLKPFGSFEDWSALVPSALVWLGYENPINARSEIDEVDESSSGINMLFDCWQKLDRNDYGMTVRNFLEVVQGQNWEKDPVITAAREALSQIMETDEDVSSVSFGFKLKSLKKRIIGGRRLEAEGLDGQQRVALWHVRSLRPATVNSGDQP